MEWDQSPLLNAVLTLGWILLSGGAVYRYLRSEWSQARTSFILGTAGGWIAFSAHEAIVLFQLPRTVGDIIFILGGFIFIVGVGYAFYTHRTTNSTAETGAETR